MNVFKLSYRLLLRDWKSGELRILWVALLVWVISTTAINFFSERVRLAMLSNASDAVGGNLLLSSSYPAPTQWRDRANSDGIETASTLSFATMVLADDVFQLASVKAVSPEYPLRGQLKISGADAVRKDVSEGPAPGKAWLDKRLQRALQLSINDWVEVGDIKLQFARVLELEPDRGSNFYDLAPRLMMHMGDVAAANVIQPGSRLRYSYLYAGEPSLIEGFARWLRPQLSSHQRLVTAREGRPALRNAIIRAEQFLNLASLVAVVLASVAIAIAAQQYAQRHFDTSAILRCFGASQSEVVGIFVGQLFLLGVFSSVVGCLVGYFLQFGLTGLLQTLLPNALPAPSFQPVWLGTGTAFLMLLGFAVPPLLKLRQVSPLRALKRDLLPPRVSNHFFYICALCLLLLMVVAYTGALVLSVFIVVGGVLAFGGFSLFSWLLFSLAEKATQHSSFFLRNSIKNLRRHSGLTISQITAFGLSFLAVALMALIRTDLINTWADQIPDNAPNHFGINLPIGEVEPLKQYLADNGVENARFFPISRGRLISINAEPIEKVVSKENVSRGDRAQRELNMTWSHSIQQENQILSGEWWPDVASTNEKLVSVESELAQRLGISVGDQLEFSLADQRLVARVASLRVVRWESFQPNFYMVFRPGDLDGFATTYMVSFNLSEAQVSLLPDMLERFSAMTLFEVAVLIEQLKTILTQVTLAIESIFVFVVISGIVVLLAAIQASLGDRIREGALWRTLGASRSEIRKMQFFEFLVIGFLAGLLATLCLEVISYFLYVRVLELAYEPKWMLWPLSLGVTLLSIVLAGMWGTRRVTSTSPLVLLRE